ncbi:MAG: TonB-dependent receptor [Lentimicrobium sp.]|nr:TonB-dependent receptor [Lentimicrobium sp.]
MMEKQRLTKSGLVSFRRWTRKAYAVFNSLGRSIRIGVLSLSCSILVLPGFSQAQPDSIQNATTDRELELDEVVVSAQRTPVVQSQLMRVVQVITRAEIAQSPATDLAGLLEHIRGVDIRQRGAFGMQADISIRGGSFDQTLILINGVNISDPQTGHHNLNIPVDLSSIQRIEVLQGPGARVFGPNAFNGVINIIAGEPEKPQLTASLSGGQYGFARASATVSVGKGNFRNFLGLSANRSDGYTENTDFKNGNLYYRTLIPLGGASFDLQAGYTARAFGANSFYTPRYPEQFEETRSQFASLKFTPPGRINLKPVVYWRRHHDRFELFRNEAPEWYKTHNYHMTDVAGGSLNWMTAGRFGKTSLGADYRFEHILSNVLGGLMDVTKPVPGEDDVLFTRSFQRQSFSLMAEQAFYLEKFSVSAGLLTHINKALPEGISLYPGIDLGWQLYRNLRWYATANRTLRLPTFTDLFYSGPTNTGNPELKPEEAVSLESGFKGSLKSLDFELSVYHRWGRNMIDWVKFPGDEKWQSLNLTEVNVTGLEAGVNIPLGRKSKNPEDLQRLSINYTWLDANKRSDGFTSLYVLDHLRHKLDLSLGHRITLNSGFELRFSWQDRAGGYLPFTDGVFTSEIPYKPVWLAGSRVYYNFTHFQLYVDASNLFDKEVIDHANVPQPGRWIVGGVKFRFSLK